MRGILQTERRVSYGNQTCSPALVSALQGPARKVGGWGGGIALILEPDMGETYLFKTTVKLQISLRVSDKRKHALQHTHKHTRTRTRMRAHCNTSPTGWSSRLTGAQRHRAFALSARVTRTPSSHSW